MSFVGDLFDSSKGAGYQAEKAPLMNLTSPEAVQAAQQQSTGALGQQQAFVNAVNAQNGLGNQSSVFNQLQGVANGTGPNPAQAMLSNATGQNVANQAALMASQRGSSANPALIARQAAQQGAATQQQAAGQGAALQANQSLGALNQLGGIAGQQVAQQAGAVGNLNQFAQGNQGQLYGAGAAQNSANLSNQQGMNTINANQALNTQQYQQGLVSGALKGIGSAAGALPGMVGGGAAAPQALTPMGLPNAGPQMPGMADGGVVGDNNSIKAPSLADAPGPKSMVGQLLSGAPSQPASGGDSGGGLSSMAGMAMQLAPLLAAHGGKVPALLSPGEKYLSPEQAKAVAKGKGDPMKAKTIPGKAKVKGDSLKNDTYKTTLDAGGVVIPRTVVNSGSKEKIEQFVQSVMARHGMRK